MRLTLTNRLINFTLNNKLDYKVAPYKKSGLLFKGQVRDFSTFKNLKGDNYLIVLNNSDSLQSYTF